MDRRAIKSAPGSHGRSMMEGELTAMVELQKWVPDIVPEPLGWGRCKLENPEAYFFVSEYVNFCEGMPDPDKLCSRLARLHRESQSSKGQFGFDVLTCQGRVLQYVKWENNWTTFFIKLLRNVIVQDFEVNGLWEDLRILENWFIERVVSRLLNALL